MIPNDTPPKFTDLEDELRKLSRRIELPDELCDRVQASVRVNLAEDTRSLSWGFAASVAAVIMLWFNVSLSAVRATDFRLLSTQPIDNEAVLAIEQMLPECSRKEAVAYALLLHGRAHFVAAPNPTRKLQ